MSIVSNLRTDPKRELWFCWYSTVAFYILYAVVFFLITRTQPPGKPWLSPAQSVEWFHDRTWGLRVGFALIFVLGGWSATAIALISYSIRRMSVSRAYAYSYLVLYLISAVPGFMFICIAMTTGALRPERSAAQHQLLYDFGFLSFAGTMGVFLIGSLIWMAAILLDKNGVFPKWFGYLNLCNALTEVVTAGSWFFIRGTLAWNGAIVWWIDVVVWGFYTVVFIYLLRDVIIRDDFGTGPLPARSAGEPRRIYQLASVIDR